MAAEALPPLEPPFNMFDVDPCQTVTITITAWKFGTAVIKPRYVGAPPEKEVVILRLYAPKAQVVEQLAKIKRLPPGLPPAVRPEEVGVPPYWDIAQRRLQEQLKPLLPAPGGPPVTVEIHKVGTPPRAFFSVRLIP
ncbi:MAG: hypothetical protein QW356_05455 [Candidatus Hadarchaeales archaeon]